MGGRLELFYCQGSNNSIESYKYIHSHYANQVQLVYNLQWLALFPITRLFSLVSEPLSFLALFLALFP